MLRLYPDRGLWVGSRGVAQGQAGLAASGSFPIAFLFFGCLDDERSDGSWLARMFVNRNESDVGGCGVFPFAGKYMLGIDFDSYFHGSVEDTVDLRFQDYDFAQIDGIAEVDVVDASGNDITIRMAAGGHRSSDIHEVHDVTTKKFSERVGLCREDDFGHLRARSVDGLPFQDLGDLLFQLACSAGATAFHGSSHLGWI